MDDLDIDNASLPSDDGTIAATPAQNRRHIPYGTLRIQEEDEPVSFSKALRDIRESGSRYHILDLSHAELGDEKIEKVFEEFNGSLTSAEKEAESQFATRVDWTDLVVPLSRLVRLHARPTYDSFRILELDGNDLTSDCLPAISQLLTGNLTLHTLCLKGNEIDPTPEEVRGLTQALGQSTLRKLLLSSNPITAKSVAAFFNTLPENGTALECLEMSNLLIDDIDDPDSAEEQALIAAKAVADFIAEPRRCRSLQTLNLYGNGFGIRGVRAIIAALCGTNILLAEDATQSQLQEVQRSPFYRTILRAKLRAPNCSLEEIGLSGNVERGWLDQDPKEEMDRLDTIRNRYASIPASDIEPIIAFLDTEKGGDTDRGEVPIEVSRHLLAIDVPLEEWKSDFDEVAEIGSGINASSWKLLKQQQLKRNMDDGQTCRQAAMQILGVARTVGCRATRASIASKSDASTLHGKEVLGFSKFLDLPPELRLLVLRHLDDKNVLSPRQFSHVISFACDASTIGYGEADYDYSRITDSHARSESQAGSSASSTLPAGRWRWNDCFTHCAPPRDWVADLLDASDHPDTARSRGSGLDWHHSTPPSLYAFLESTSTQRAEW